MFIPESRRPNTQKVDSFSTTRVCDSDLAPLFAFFFTMGFLKLCHVCWRNSERKPHVWCWGSSITLCEAIVPTVALTFGTVRTYESWKWDTCEHVHFDNPWGSVIVSRWVDRPTLFQPPFYTQNILGVAIKVNLETRRHKFRPE